MHMLGCHILKSNHILLVGSCVSLHPKYLYFLFSWQMTVEFDFWKNCDQIMEDFVFCAKNVCHLGQRLCVIRRRRANCATYKMTQRAHSKWLRFGDERSIYFCNHWRSNTAEKPNEIEGSITNNSMSIVPSFRQRKRRAAVESNAPTGQGRKKKLDERMVENGAATAI